MFLRTCLRTALLPCLIAMIPAVLAQQTFQALVDTQRNAPTAEGGNGETSIDLWRRLLASIESVDIDESETVVKLTWNVNQRFAAILEILEEPELYGPIREAFSADAELLQTLSGRIEKGDDWTFRARYTHSSRKEKAQILSSPKILDRTSKDNGGGPGSIRISGRAAAFQALDSPAEPDFTTKLFSTPGVLSSASGDNEAARLFIQAITNVPEWEVNTFYTRRDRLAGPDEYGGIVKYTWAPGSVNDEENLKAVLINAGLFKQSEQDQAKTMRRLKRIEKKQRLAAKVDFKKISKLDLTSSLPSPFVKDDNESLTATLAYSLEWPTDKGEDPSRVLPRYEFQLSYEDVDDDPARQDRLIARAIVSKTLGILGEATELTVGLVYSNKPEFLADEDLDEQFGANVGLTFKYGKTK